MAERIDTEAQLDEALSCPTPEDVAALSKLDGDLLLLGAGGKMGPSLARLARRAGKSGVVAVSRFSSKETRDALERDGIRTIACDLLDVEQMERLPDAKNVVFMAGQKFGTSGQEPMTWAENTWAPGLAARRFRNSRFIIFSTGNVYPLTRVASGGPTESHPTGPIGEYAQSALGRERLFQFFNVEGLIVRLNYAVELRYGVLRDIAERVLRRETIDVSMGHVNVIWQRDANSVALRAFAHVRRPPLILNVTGPEILSVRKLAAQFGKIFGVEPTFTGAENDTALLSNAARCRELFGPPTVSIDRVIPWVADWVMRGGRGLGKPTHFETRDGRF